ncbi:MAG: LysR family transcriptional regulator [Pontibacterium sp.]
MKIQVTLEQWQALITVVDKGGYAQAAEALGKSQSAISYAIQKLEGNLGISVLAIQGRKAELTAAGQSLYQRARVLVDEAQQIEVLAKQFGQSWEAEINLAVDTLFPPWILLDALSLFSQESPHTRIDVQETVLSGTRDALVSRSVELFIGGQIPPGFLGNPLMRVRFIATAHPEHPLHQQNRSLTHQDLRQHRQLVVRDSGIRRTDSGWLGSQQRLTLSNQTTAIEAACKGLGYAWFPEEKIRQELKNNQLKFLPLKEGAERFIELYLVYSQGEYAGPGTRRLGEIIRQQVEACCTLKPAS